MQLKIDVFHYPTREFLGTRYAPYNVFENGEKIVSNANEINSQVNEVRQLHNKKENEVFFKTTIIN
jgi:hypothetical protein